MIQKFIIHFSVLLWFLRARCRVTVDITRSVSVGVNSMFGVRLQKQC